MQREELSYYGAIIAKYEGNGCLSLKNGWQWKCVFEAGQFSDGKVLLICHISLNDIPPTQRSQLHLVDSAKSFKGITGEYSIYSTEGFRVLNKFFNTRIKPANYVVAYFMRNINICAKTGSDIKELHFGITNFDLIEVRPKLVYEHGSMAEGIMAFSIREDIQPENLNLHLKNDTDNSTIDLSIKPLPNYCETMNRVKILKSIDVTCEVVVSIKQEIDYRKAEQIISNLCYLLSIARGTKIHWIYCCQFNSVGECVSRRHVSKEPKPFCPLYTISPSADLSHMKNFIECGYPIFVKKNESYRLDKGTIDAYLDAKAEPDYISIRAVKLAVSIEILKDAFLESMKSQGISINEFIIDKNFFNKKIQPKLKEAIKGIISEAIEEKRSE